MNFIKVFYAGMWLMRKMRFRTKLALLLATLIVPMFFIVWQLMARDMGSIDTSRAEIEGIALVDNVSQLTRQVQAHRGLNHMVLSGNTAATANRDKAREAIATALAALVKQADQTRYMHLPAEWAALRGRVDGLQAELNGKAAAESFALHTALVEDLGRFIYGIAESSELLYDPDPLTYLLMDMTVSRTVPWAEQLARLRGAGAGALSKAAVSDADAGSLRAMIATLDAGQRDIRYATGLIEKFKHQDPAAQAALAATDSFMQLARQQFVSGAAAGDAQAFFSSGTQTLEAVTAYQANSRLAVSDLLKTRLSQLQVSFWVTVVGVSVATLAVLYLMLSFNISFLSDLRQVMMFMEETASGNLRHKTHIRGEDELSDMSHSMDVMVNNMSVMVAAVRSNSALVASSGETLVLGNQQLSDRTEQQAANLEQTAASVQELAATVVETAQTAMQSDQAAQQVRTVAEAGARGMVDAIASIEAIEASTRRMDEIVGVIDGLAFQTNILALNAAVEAARAGESGRGFAVVAAEVRSLAQRSAASAREIRQLIGASTAQVERGVRQIRTAGLQMDSILEGVRSVAGNMSLISASSAEQSASLTEISAAVRQLDEITQNNAAMVEVALGQATDLQSRATVLADAATSFKLQQGTADEARELVQRAILLRKSAGSRDAFVRAVTPNQSGLFDRDMYVFVLEESGRYLAFGGNPSKVGTRVQDVPGIDGDALMDAITNQASVAPGWVEYDITNPSSGKVQTKISYVVQVDDVYVGCGVYKSLSQAV